MKSVFLIAVLLLSACGFSPVYGTHEGTPAAVESQLLDVAINNIPDREGQYLRNALIDRFYRNGWPQNTRYTLDVSRVRERNTKLDITKTADATRAQLKLDVHMTLLDGNKKLLERDLRAITSYNILSSEFATRVTEDNARTNALDDLARQIELQLSLIFTR